ARTAGGAISSDQLYRNSYGSLPGTAPNAVGASTDLSSVQNTRTSSSRSKWPYALAALGVLALAGAAGGVFMLQKKAAEASPAAVSSAAPSPAETEVPEEAPAPVEPDPAAKVAEEPVAPPSATATEAPRADTTPPPRVTRSGKARATA